MRREAVVSWSGGKDSALTLAALRSAGCEPVALLTSMSVEYDRVSIHGVRRSLLEKQAAAVGMPLFTVELPERCSNEQYEASFLAALADLQRHVPNARVMAFGDLFLEDVRRYRERLLANTLWEPVFPLWGEDTALIARDFVEGGFRARVVCVDTTLMDADFAGREVDSGFLAALPAPVDPCGERGEFHTFVSDGPGFSASVPYDVGSTVLREGRFAYCDLLDRR